MKPVATESLDPCFLVTPWGQQTPHQDVYPWLFFFSLTVTEKDQFLVVTHFPALEATSFIPECASGSDEEVQTQLAMGREPQPSLKSGDIYRVASGRDSDAARLGTKGAQILGPAWSSGRYWSHSGQWSRIGQEGLGPCLVSPLLLAPCPEAQVGGGVGGTQPPTVEAGPSQSCLLASWDPPCHLPTSCQPWLLGRNIT